MTEVEESIQPVQIREYKPSDYPEVRLNLEEGNLFDPTWDSEQNLKEKIERNPGSILVASIDNKVVGNVYIVEDGWGAFIFRLAVRKEFREQGIGTKLMAEAEEKLRQKGIKEISIFVDESDEELKNYYTKQGYIPTVNYRCMYKVLK